MRRAVNGSSLKRLLAAGAQAIEASAVTWKTAVNEAQAGNARQKTITRFFSHSRITQSSAVESSTVAQAPPYAMYGAVGAAGLGIISYYVSRQPADSAVVPVVLKPAPEAPPDTAQIGEFHVMDHIGMHFTQDDLLGDFAVLYFGRIDDPGRKQRLLQMAEAVVESDRKSNMHYLTPVFATLDSKNDDVIKMSAMVEDYATALNRKSILHVRLKGLVGDDNLKLHKRAQEYTMMVKAKSGIENPEAATQRDAGDLYFVNPKGEFIASYGPDASPKAIAAEWSEMMKAYKLSHPSWHGPKAVKERQA